MRNYRDVLKNITMIGQFGLSLMMPVLICVGVCWYICDKTGAGAWVYIIGIIFGIISSFMTAYKFYLSIVEKQKKEEKPKISFNNH